MQAGSGTLAPAGFSLTNRPGQAASVSVDLNPQSIAADGSSTTTATATVTDANGNPVSGDDVFFTSNGGQQIGATTDNGDGSYAAQITSTTTPGESTITATDVFASPHVTGTAALTQTDVTAPAPPVITAPANNSYDTDGTITLSGTAEANSTVEVFEGTNAEGTNSGGTAPVDSSGAWSKMISTRQPDGSHTYTAEATDAANNTSGRSNARTVMVDTDKPEVNAGGATPTGKGVKRDTNLTATFSEKMDPATLSAATFELFKVNPDGTIRQVANVVVGLNANGVKAKLDPFGASTTVLAKNVKYKAVITTGAKDLAGNSLDQNPSKEGSQQKVWTFTTGAS